MVPSLNILVIGSSTETTLFHVGCKPSFHVGIHLHHHPFFMLDVGLSTYIQPWEAYLATMLERLSTYIRPWEAQLATM